MHILGMMEGSPSKVRKAKEMLEGSPSKVRKVKEKIVPIVPVKDGPKNRKERLQWYKFAISEMLGPSAEPDWLHNFWMGNLVRNLNGLNKIGHWDGVDCAGMILQFYQKELAGRGYAVDPHINHHACDKDRASLIVLENLDAETAPGCCFAEMEERLPKSLVQLLDQMEPPAGTPVAKTNKQYH